MTTPIDIIDTVPTKDAEGFAVSSDTILASVRAYKEDRHGTKMWANRAAFSSATTLFRFRAIPGVPVTDKQVILCAGVRYRILCAEDVRSRGMYIECLCDRWEASKNG
jgi:Phage head-tail joining protein.